MRARSARVIAVAIMALGMVLAVAGCGVLTQGEGEGAPDRVVRMYGTDGNMSNAFGNVLKENPSVLNGMKGTTPLTPLSDDFKRRVKAVDSTLNDFNYAGESYDAVIIAGLAAEAARTVEPAGIAKQLIGTTTGENQCDTVAACLAAARAGRDFKYRGVSLRRSGLTEVGEPSSAMYGVLNFGRNNLIDEAKTEYVGAGDEKTEQKAVSPTPGPVKGRNTTALKIGLLLPKTGGLAFQGPPMFAGARLAVKELNDAGGVLGQQVVVEEGDDGTSPGVANATVDKFINAGVHVIIGAGASGVSKAVMPKVVQAGKVMISPSATSDELTKIDDKGLFFRTSPPDNLQAKALTDIIMRDGHTRIGIVARDDSYGKGLADAVQADLNQAGIKADSVKVSLYQAKDTYDPKTEVVTLFAPIAREFKAFGADAVLLIGFDESAFVIQALVAEGVKV